MRSRYFKTDAGWLSAVMGTEGDEFSVGMEQHEADLSAHYGVPVTGVEVDGEDADPRKLPYIPEPPQPVPEVQLSKLDQVLALLAADKNLAPETATALEALKSDG